MPESENIPYAFKAEPSKEDPRTLSSDKALAFAGVPPVKHRIDYSGIPHKDQEKVGICTAASVTRAAEKFLIATGAVPPDWRGSMEWLYKIGKVFIDGALYEGSSAFTMLKAANKYGIPSEKLFPSNCNRPYADFMKNVNITEEMLADAAKHKIPGYVQVPVNKDSLMRALSASVAGLITRMEVGNNWWTDAQGNWTNDPAKIQPLRAPGSIIAGHLIIQGGYDATMDYKATDENSWGDNWCDHGNVDFFLSTQAPYFTEAWMITEKQFFTKDLRVGTTHDDVLRLQKYLNANGFPVAVSGNGSPGHETMYFGTLTWNALKKFQAAKGIPATGYFGPMTRDYINTH